MYPAKYRLKHDKDIARVLKSGKSTSGVFLRLKYIKNKLDHPRFAVVVGKKVHKSAVERNKKKRQIREIIRKSMMNQGFSFARDVVVITQKSIMDKDFQQISDELCGLLGVNSRK